MSAPIELPGPGGGRRARHARARGAGYGAVASLAVVAGTVLLGVAAGFGWVALAPRPLLVVASPGAAGLASAESSALITADAIFCLLCLAGGVVSGLLGYLFAVRRYGPLPMAAVLVGAVAAAYVTRWIGQRAGLAAFHHLLATLPAGASLRGTLILGASSGLAFWPLAAGLVAGGLVLLAKPVPTGAHDVDGPAGRPLAP